VKATALEPVAIAAPEPGGPGIEELYARYAGAVFARCRFLLRSPSEAEDAMQEVFTRAFTHREGFRAEASPLTWLITIATRHCLNQLRSKGAAWHAEHAREEQHRGEGREGPGEARELVRQLLARFDDETQEAAVLYHVDEMTLDEVAAALGRSVPTIRKRLTQFAEQARKVLAPAEDGP
jgi:RNA polymerase sigma factor (sigma-70 family)